ISVSERKLLAIVTEPLFAEERRAGIFAMLADAISMILKVPLSEIEIDVPWEEYGFDSLSLTKLTNKLNAGHGLDLVPTIFFDRLTPGQFVSYLLDRHPDAFWSDRLDSEISPDEGVYLSRLPAAVGQPAERQSGQQPAATGRNQDAASLDDAVAIIGMSGSFAMAPDLDAFWQNLTAGRDCVTEIPADRWNWRDYWNDAERDRDNKHWGAFMAGVDRFDPLFFDISPREAEFMDPQQRLLMMHVWNALEDAGHAPQSLAGSRTGIFVGTAPSGYAERVLRAHPELEGHH
ncbi:type I polyketide synthase, partial [Sphingobium yanoikuyae]